MDRHVGLRLCRTRRRLESFSWRREDLPIYPSPIPSFRHVLNRGESLCVLSFAACRIWCFRFPGDTYRKSIFLQSPTHILLRICGKEIANQIDWIHLTSPFVKTQHGCVDANDVIAASIRVASGRANLRNARPFHAIRFVGKYAGYTIGHIPAAAWLVAGVDTQPDIPPLRSIFPLVIVSGTQGDRRHKG